MAKRIAAPKQTVELPFGPCGISFKPQPRAGHLEVHSSLLSAVLNEQGRTALARR
jgi:hypothetical protein